jgi:di/tricarboxylate transporter
MATKNVGALAIMMPVALQVARRTGSAPSRLLMPMAFGAMAGGMVTLVGTAPNIIVAQVRQEVVGQSFGMYDFAPVGLGLTAIALAFLAFGYRLLPRSALRTTGRPGP